MIPRLNARIVRLALAGLAGVAPAALAAPPELALVTPERIVAEGEFHWSIPLGLRNPTAGGLYLDSLVLVTEDRGPGETRADRVRRTSLDVLIKLLPAVAAGDSGVVQFEGTATAEHAKLTFVLDGHTASGERFTLRSTTLAGPGRLSEAYPSDSLTVNGRAVETVWVGSPAGHEGALPAVLLVHGHAGHARTMLPRAHALASRGYHVMAVSMPGYGRSAGPADFMGPHTVDALSAAVDALAARSGVRRDRIAVWGFSRGATAATLLATRRADLAGVIAQSGVYDLWAVHRGTRIDGFAEGIVREVGRDSSAWRARSPILAAAEVKAPLFVLHGEDDPNVPFAQAKAFVEAVRAAGHPVESLFLPRAGHELAGFQVQRTTTTFLTQRLKD